MYLGSEKDKNFVNIVCELIVLKKITNIEPTRFSSSVNQESYLFYSDPYLLDQFDEKNYTHNTAHRRKKCHLFDFHWKLDQFPHLFPVNAKWTSIDLTNLTRKFACTEYTQTYW